VISNHYIISSVKIIFKDSSEEVTWYFSKFSMRGQTSLLKGISHQTEIMSVDRAY
jgi:hypothetical protein